MSSRIDLKDFEGFNIDIEFKDIVDEYANKTQKLLGLYSPKRKFKRANNYASTWVIKEYDQAHKLKGKKYGATIWNDKNYRLAHLLENGHLIVNKKGGVGWASANPHIDRVYRNVKQPFEQAMKRAKVDVQFK